MVELVVCHDGRLYGLGVWARERVREERAEAAAADLERRYIQTYGEWPIVQREPVGE